MRTFLLYLSLFTLIMSSNTGLAQYRQYSIANNDFFKRLGKSSLEYIPIRGTPNNGDLIMLPLVEPPLNHVHQNVFLHKKRLYVTIPSTGVVYASETLDASRDSIHFNRIDSTLLYGYNYDCYSFIYNDTLYNYGGYGFWRFNGQLRQFNTKLKEWDLAPVNKEIAYVDEYSNAKIWFNLKGGSLYLLTSISGNEAIKTGKINLSDSVHELDLKTKNWQFKGILNEKIFNSKITIGTMGILDSGLLVSFAGQLQVWNLISNKIYKIIDAPYKQLLSSQLGHGYYTWMEGNKFYYSKNNLKSPVDSIEIKSNELVATDETIYTGKDSTIGYLSYSILAFGLVFIVILILKKTRLISLSRRNEHSADMNDIDGENNKFNELEKSIIKLIIDKTANGSYYTVDEINQSLGIKRKTIEIQKKIRTEFINRMNHKFNVNCEMQTIFIERIRSEEDRRFFNYIINKNNATLFEKLN